MRRIVVMAATAAAVLMGGVATASAASSHHRGSIETWRYHQQRAHHYDGRYADTHWRSRPWYMGRRQDWASSATLPVARPPRLGRLGRLSPPSAEAWVALRLRRPAAGEE